MLTLTSGSLQMYDFRELQALFADGLSSTQVSLRVGSSEISSLMGSSAMLLNAAPAAPAWLAYVSSVATTVVNGVADMLLSSLRYLLAQVIISQR